MLAALFGGIGIGLGIGIVFRGNASTGGTDLAAQIISKYTAAFPEIMVTSSFKNNGIGILRTYLASFA